MGFIDAAPDDRVEYLVVETARGTMRLGVAAYEKARVFVLENRTVVVVLPGPEDPDALSWDTYAVDTANYSPVTKILTVRLADGGELVLDGNGCGCNMGAVGNAGPNGGPYKLTPVRNPEWYTVT